jgi:putative ABC transport system permease protein
MSLRAAPALLVARALGRAWLHRPVRLVVAIAGGIGGVLLSTAVLMIAMPVIESTKAPPIKGLKSGVIAVSASAPAGISGELASSIVEKTDPSAASGLVIANTTVRYGARSAPVVVLGVDTGLEPMVESKISTRLPTLEPNEAYLSRSWARARGLRVGDRLQVITPTGLLGWRVAALLNTEIANNGSAVIVQAATVASAFERGSSISVLLLRAHGSVSALKERAEVAAHGAGEVVLPQQVFASYARIYRTPLMLVAMLGGVALLVGCVVLFLTWRLALVSVRSTLARLSLLGVRSRDLLAGSGLVLIPVLLICYLVGASAGALVGQSLSSFRGQILNFTDQAFNPATTVAVPLLGGLLVSIVMFSSAWLTGLWELRRATAVEAVMGQDAVAGELSPVRLPIIAGVVSMILAGAILAFATGAPRGTAIVPLGVGVTLLSATLPMLVGAGIRSSSSGPSGLLVGRQLQVQWRRNAALAVTFAITLLSSLATFGVTSSVLAAINSSNERWTKGQIYVTAAPLGHNYEGETFPASVRREIAATPGVASTDTFSYVDAVVRGGRHLVETVGGDTAQLTAPRLTAGPAGTIDGSRTLFDILTGDDIAISSNFARTQHLSVGDTLELPSSDGQRAARIVAVIDDSISDGGMVMVGPQLFAMVAGESRVFYVGVGLAHGADAALVRARLGALVEHRYPRAQVLSVSQYRSAVSSLLGRLMSSFGVFAWVMFGVAAVVGTATLASSIAERGRAVAVTRLVGSSRSAARRLLGIEAIVTVTIAWLVAVLAAQLAIPALISGQSAFTGLLPRVQAPTTMIGASLPMAVLATFAALLVARRSVSERPLAELIADE